jgi:peroxiredoxin
MSNPVLFPTLKVTAVILVMGTAFVVPARAQETTKPDTGKPASQLESVAAIDGLYRKELDDIERRRLERLAVLAGKQAKDEANQTYETYFRSAIAANLFADAEPIAIRVLQSKETSSRVILLADLVKIMAEVGRGAFDESLASLTAALDDPDRAPAGAVAGAPHPLPVDARIALLDAYFQRLSQGDQFAIAKKAFTAVRDRTTDAGIKAFAASRLARLDLIGKPAPSINGNDLDGRPVHSVDFQGNVVLVVFWASWCVNNAEEVARLDAVYSAYRDRGLRIVGISLDSLQDGGKNTDASRSAARHFLLEYNVRWPNLINGSGDQDFARAYAVSEIPANVLIGRDGTVIHLDLTRSNLEKVIARAVGR